MLQAQFGEHPQVIEVRRVVESADESDVPSMREIAECEIKSPEDTDNQFAFQIEVFLDGLALWLDSA